MVSGIRVRRMGNANTVYLHALRYLTSSTKMANYDVVFDSINTVPFFAPLVSKAPVVAQIYSIENRLVLFDEIPLRKFLLFVGAYIASSSIPRIYRECEAITISQYSKAHLVAEGFCPEMVHVAYPGISDAFRELLDASPEARRPNHTIVYLGRLKKYKGVQDIIFALHLIKKEIPDVKLLLIGRGDYEEQIRMLVSKLGLGETVKFCGFVSERQKALLLKSASLYLCTSRDEGGWTISAAEAMAAGVPILVTESQRDVIEDGSNGYLLPDSRPATIAEKVCGVLRDPSEWERLSENAEAFSGQFNWDITASVTMSTLVSATSK